MVNEVVSKQETSGELTQKELDMEAYDALSVGEVQRRKAYLQRYNPQTMVFSIHDIVNYSDYEHEETDDKVRTIPGSTTKKKKNIPLDKRIKNQGVPAVLSVMTIGIAYAFFSFLQNATF